MGRAGGAHDLGLRTAGIPRGLAVRYPRPPRPPCQWRTATLPALEPFRHRADPLADAAVAGLPRQPQAAPLLQRVRAAAQRGDPACCRFLEATWQVPPWFDPARIEPGRRAAMRQAPVTFLVLLTASLLESFALPEPARLLVATGRLRHDPLPRLHETASMLRDVLLPGGLQPGQPGHLALVQVRLLHARVRSAVRQGPTVPINQLELLHTLLCFSRVMARGLTDLGVHLTDAERDGWCQLWRRAGDLLGVDPALLPATVDEETQRYREVRNRYAPDRNAQELTASVLHAAARQPPFHLPARALAAISRRLLGDRLADAFALPKSQQGQAFAAGLAGVTRTIDCALRRLPGGKVLALAGGHAFLEGHRWRVQRRDGVADFRMRVVVGQGGG